MGVVTRENIGLLNDKITVKVIRDDYLPSFEKALKDYGKKANIPGFRKGMVPPSLIKKMYGSSVFTDQVLRSVEKELSEYMTSEKLEIFAQPLPLPENDAEKIDMTKPGEYSFAFEVGLKPQFEIPALDQLDIVRYKIEVSDKMLDEETERLRTRYGKMTEPETIESDEHILRIQLTESDDQGNPLENGISKEISLPLKYFSEKLRTAWKGRKKEDQEIIRLADAFEEKELPGVLRELGLAADDPLSAGKYFIARISGIGFNEKAELNEEFFKTAYKNRNIQSEAEFREAVKADILVYLDEQSRNQFHHSLYHEILDHVSIGFPENFLKRWMQQGTGNPKSLEQVENEFHAFANQLKWTLISDRILRENKLEIHPEDLRQYARKQLMGYMRTPENETEQPWITDYVNRVLQDKKFVEEAANRVQTDKVFAWAEEKVRSVEKPVSVEEFNKLQQDHQHQHHAH